MGAMPESVPVRCPACRRERLYTAPSYPCACGSPVTPVLDRRTAPTAVAHRAWDDEWIALRCRACGRRDQFPRPEFGCACGTTLRIPVAEPKPETAPAPEAEPAQAPAPAPAARRPAFRPVAIRTALDAVKATALYLNWLGHEGIRRADQRPTCGIGLAARGLLVQVDPSVRPASLRDVECLWLTAMTESADCVYFSLAGYDADARARADQLHVPLFVLDLAGTPQPVNALADALDARGGNRYRGR
ncbi:hypothetical protein [Streptomyces sp. NPDC050121]|jgi:hypothetical protein|uniref:hypothetical protein n=1 Tax=Streptomyces sp. NPDC050121 TaxID=3365601 RepID=UPI003796F738